MSEPCLEPCPAHICIELTKAGMCRHERAALRGDLQRVTAERDEARAESAARLVTIQRESAWVNERGGVIAFFVGVLAEVLRAKTIEDARTFAETALVTNEEWHAGTWKPGPGEDAANWRKR